MDIVKAIQQINIILIKKSSFYFPTYCKNKTMMGPMELFLLFARK